MRITKYRGYVLKDYSDNLDIIDTAQSLCYPEDSHEKELRKNIKCPTIAGLLSNRVYDQRNAVRNASRKAYRHP